MQLRSLPRHPLRSLPPTILPGMRPLRHRRFRLWERRRCRDDPNQNTGISILECKIATGSELIPNQSMFKSYLGRPWKEYSRTVILRSYIGDVIDPAGWLEWDGNQSLSTLYYGEYRNTGPGSNTSVRVTWPGYKKKRP
ncbi:hypothetical protein L2E82_19687 [Cichorium intybus]|uniref:Uncharacterized protein n=1 Tax=Cichorium intybus TaxID=13427 RepID=A0ACB9FDS2_CICIN|nr:hypothetical protein L2E82_19687 [Cichorium intybus]